MKRNYRAAIGAAAIVLVLAFIVGWLLEPAQPSLIGDRGYQDQPKSYQAGGSKCAQTNAESLAPRSDRTQTDACAEAEEEHRIAANNLLEAQRSVAAAEASAMAVAAQARTEAWGAAVGFLTLIAAVAAAFFAKKAADHTERSADSARDTLHHQIETTNKQLRAYVSIGIPTITKIRDGVWGVRFPLLNTGATPATDVVARVGTGLSPFPVPRNAIKPEGLQPVIIANIAPAGQRARYFEHEIGTDVMELLRGRFCYIYGLQVSYTTFTGERIEESDYWWFARETELARGHPSALEHQFEDRDEDLGSTPFGQLQIPKKSDPRT